MLLQIHWNIDSEIFRIGGFALRYYTLCFLMAFAFSYWLLSRIYKKEGADKTLLGKLTVYVLIGTIVGARLGHCLFYEFDYYKTKPWEIILPFRWENGRFELTGFQGLASHGGAIGILTAVGLYCRKYKTSMLWVLDRLVIAVAIAGFFIRTGNFFNSEIIGKPTNLPWAVVFERVDNVARHPAQLYEAICYAGIFVLLLLFYRRRIAFTKPGFLFGLFLITVFGVRFCMEFLKENQEAFEEGLLLNMGQLLSIPLIIVGLFFTLRKQKLYEG
jgi:phosphatidylglycerol---prolipoprotein diacylglyceryl transferase